MPQPIKGRIITKADLGGAMFRTPLLALAMNWFALRDRLGF